MTVDEVCPKCGVNFQRASMALGEQLRVSLQSERRKASSGISRLERFCWIATVIGSVLGILQIVATALSAASAPQQAAGAGLAVATAAVPYCLARAVQLGFRNQKSIE
ncbi:hypothetical protein [Dokdonella sp.]|uniref:hypothetical protein n=1 Tax=Dokdonella sp. TaxID=2291710 RepID=UPI001B16BA6A|nr:hypothetical protein [Dokdonella sp.]MBO9664950.1 hypothetical protein [Dokdonella sp.]